MERPLAIAYANCLGIIGAPGRIRTSDPLVRSPEPESQLADLFINLAVAPVANCTTSLRLSVPSPAKYRQTYSGPALEC